MLIQLQIKHIDSQNEPPQFAVLRGSDLKSSAPVEAAKLSELLAVGR